MNLIPFQELCIEAMDHMKAYNENKETLNRTETQNYRDHLSYIGSVMAYYCAEFYYDSIKAEFRRRIGESKEMLELKKSGACKTQSEAEATAKVNCEPLYNEEAETSHLHMRAKLLREQLNQTLNSMSSRLVGYEKE